MKKILSLLLTFGLLTVPVLATEESQAEPLPAWAWGEMADAYALGLVGDEIYTDHSKPVTQEQLDKMTQVAADKLVLLEVEQRSNAGSFVIDTTRGGVLNALYMEALPYAFAGVDAGPVEFLSSLGVVHGDGASLALDRPCTLLEAACFANRMILAL